MRRAFEHQVLEQVREAGQPGPFVLGSDVIPDADRHERRVMVLVDDDVEAVVERALGEGRSIAIERRVSTFTGDQSTGIGARLNEAIETCLPRARPRR